MSLGYERQRVNGDAIIPIRIGLRQSNLHMGYEKLMEVSHPASEKYGQHLSKEEVHSLFAPAEETVEIVKNWLLGSGLFDKSDIMQYKNKGWLAVDMPGMLNLSELFKNRVLGSYLQSGLERIATEPK